MFGYSLLNVSYVDEFEYNYVNNYSETIPELDPYHYKPVYLKKEAETRYPIIVWWVPLPPEQRVIKKCSIGSCLFTQSRTEYDNPLTEGFMFYGTTIQWDDLPLPRKPNHKWFLFHEESPKNSIILQSAAGISLFNYTATCSRHSSYPLVTQHLESIEWLLDPVRHPPSAKSKGDIGLVMYLHSDCNVPSDRDSYAAELMKYVKLDSYGTCLHNKDLPEHLRDPVDGMESPDLVRIISQYKFVLAFENAICDDYITEKLWRTFRAGSVPIYKGSPSVMDWAPDDHSIILVDDFSSPRELAKYLIYLDDNDDEYEKYLTYKKQGVTNERLLEDMKNRNYDINYMTATKPDMVEGFQCYICDRLHERIKLKEHLKSEEYLPKVIADKSHYNSYPVRPSLNIVENGEPREGLGIPNFWKDHFSCGEREAIAISSAIAAGGNASDIKAILSCT